jgi:hypothetical protein
MGAKIEVAPSGVDFEIETPADGAQLIGDKLANHGKDDGHILAGADEIDGDKVGIDFTPTNYTPDTSPPEATDVDHLAAHLAGLDNGLGVTAVPTSSNKNMAALTTTSDGDSATATAVATTPSNDSHVFVSVNGQPAVVADGEAQRTSSECYFSGDGGTTALFIKDVVTGSLLYWNGSVAGYQLASSDRIAFDYDV